MLHLIEAWDLGAILSIIKVRAFVILICWLFAVISSLIDLWSGISTARALGEKINSSGLRRTVAKVGDYIQLLLFALMVDVLGSLMAFYVLPFTTMLCTLSVICIEGKSVIENSRRKRAHAADVPEVIKQIVQTVTAEQGVEVFNKIVKQFTDEKNK